MENQTNLTKTAVHFAHLDHRADIRKAKTSRIPKIKSSARKQDTNLPSKKKRKPRSCSPSVNNENKVHLNLIHTRTAVELARLDNRGSSITKAENSRSHKTQSSVRKQASSFAAVQKRKPRSRSPSVNNENKVHLNLIHTRTAVELARLDNRRIITKAEISRSQKTQSFVRKQASSFAAVQKRKPRSRSPSVNNKNNEDINSNQNHGRIAQSVRASC